MHPRQLSLPTTVFVQLIFMSRTDHTLHVHVAAQIEIHVHVPVTRKKLLESVLVSHVGEICVLHCTLRVLYIHARTRSNVQCTLGTAGFVSTLVRDLWTLVDGEESDYRLTAPRTHPLDPIDRTTHKVPPPLSECCVCTHYLQCVVTGVFCNVDLCIQYVHVYMFVAWRVINGVQT